MTNTGGIDCYVYCAKTPHQGQSCHPSSPCFLTSLPHSSSGACAPFPDHIFTLQGCSQFVTHAEEKGIAYVGGNLVGGSRKSVVLYKYDTGLGCWSEKEKKESGEKRWTDFYSQLIDVQLIYFCVKTSAILNVILGIYFSLI